MGSTLSNILLHIVTSTKLREPLITDDIRERLYDYIGGTVRGEGGILLEIGGVEDHIHMLVKWRTDATVADLMRNVKAGSSSWVHTALNRPFAWQEGYAAFSVSESGAEDVRAYIRGQREHHRTITFKEELLAFLRKHGVKYDERYLWD